MSLEYIETSIYCSEISIVNEADIDVAFVPALLRRCLSLATRLALTAAYKTNNKPGSCRLVYASRYGEYDKTYSILKDIQAGKEISPAAFIHSVHNTPAGLYAIATGDKAATSSISAGISSLEAAFLEATLMVEEAPLKNLGDVIVVYVDVPLPVLYAKYKQDGEQPYAIAMRLTRQENGNPLVRLGWRQAPVADEPAIGLPASGLKVMDLILGHRQSVILCDGRLEWRWKVGYEI